jgi:ATP-dependent DNA helicase RecG
VGIEDDGEVSGMTYPEDRIAVLVAAPKRLVQPPMRVQVIKGKLEGKPVLVFEVDWSIESHQLTDGRYLLRCDDKNMPFAASDIETLKEGKRRRVTETRFIGEATMRDIDTTLLRKVAHKLGIQAPPGDILSRYRLAEGRNGKTALTLAALLLFGKDPMRWHPRCDIDFVKYEGTQRQSGASYNVVKRERIEGPLVTLIGKAYETIRPHVRERQRLVDLFFEERFEYPTFAWQEAIVNAVAHRDYRYEGSSIEVWMFDDRLEIRSPGELVEPVTIEHLQKRERIHASRNPRIVRVLTDLGFMREQGEGIPRMFDAMEREGLHPPELLMEAGAIFTVAFKNTVALSTDTMRWLQRFASLDLTGNQKRILAFAKEHDGAFTNRDYQRLIGADIYAASQDIKNLIRKGVVKLPQKGGRTYEVIEHARADSKPERPDTYIALEPTLKEKGFVKNADIQKILDVPAFQANRIAQRLTEAGLLVSVGEKRGRHYIPRH